MRRINSARPVAGLGYSAATMSPEDEMLIYDGLPKPLRSIISDMPARANVLKYERIWMREGLGRALDYARQSARRFHDAASAEKASGEYWQ